MTDKYDEDAMKAESRRRGRNIEVGDRVITTFGDKWKGTVTHKEYSKDGWCRIWVSHDDGSRSCGGTTGFRKLLVE